METDPNSQKRDSLKGTGGNRVGLFSRFLRRETVEIPEGTNIKNEKRGPRRRNFLIGSGLLLADALIGGPFSAILKGDNLKNIGNFVEFNIIRRINSPSKNDAFYPLNIDEGPIDRTISDKIFDDSNLAEEYPNTINKASFHSILQKPARIALQYFKPNESYTYEQKLRSLNEYYEDFFGYMKDISDAIGIDYIANLLMWQVSGENTAHIINRLQDERDEFARTFTTVAETWLGDKTGSHIITVLRKMGIADDAYYALPRLEGATSLGGPHDLENIFQTRAIADLKNTTDLDTYNEIMKELRELAPDYCELIPEYVAAYDAFEKKSTDVKQAIISSDQIRNYLIKFATEDRIKDLMSEVDDKGEVIVDSYQFSRTTAFWATLSEKDAVTRASGMTNWETGPIEQAALNLAIEYYLEDDNSKVGFFFDQIRNPKMIDLLKSRKNKGDSIASQLLKMSDELDELSEKVITKDREVALSLVKDGLEYDPKFNIIVGVAYTKWVYAEVLRYKNITDPQIFRNIKFNSPDVLALASLLANALRETGPSYQLVGKRPLLKATLPFIDKYEILNTMDRFIKQIYSQTIEAENPERDYETFSTHYINLILDQMSTYYLKGAKLSDINASFWIPEKLAQFRNFSNQAINFGLRRILFTPPHDAWTRGILNNAAYIYSLKGLAKPSTNIQGLES